MKIEELTSYEIIEKRPVSDLNSLGYLLKHKKTGARITLLSNDDENKVFYIGFRTPPTDSTGIAHILEHSVLCGSKNFPIKDPFVELAKGSLNTFLNAMTYPDKTVYPVASCNDKDFQNLIHVYLDAVFYPNIYKENKIFKQEGWHYEMEDSNDELTLNGVVYNEMKGAFSSPDGVFDREVFNSLFPDTTYGFESGGDPEVIPELTYDEFLAFHSRYYHPSNSYIYLYGNLDMAEKLKWIDEQYLSSFDQIEIDSAVGVQKSFETVRETKKEYSITDGESLKDNTYLSYNTVISTSLDKELYLAFQVLDYALCSAPGAPLKQALIDKGIGKDVYSVYENGIFQPYFSIVAKGANEEQKEEFLKTIHDILEVQSKGIEKKSLRAGLNFYEFKYREADFGSYPKGLMYGLQALDSWLYDDSAPFMHIEANEVFGILKEKINSDYFETLISKYLIGNKHKSVVIIVPSKNLTSQNEQKLAAKLLEYKKSLSEAEIQEIISETIALKKYQEEEDTKEDIEKIPLLRREDMKKNAEPFINEVVTTQDTKILFHNIFTNGIAYIKLIFSLETIPGELIPYLGILKDVLGFVDTKSYSYGELFNEINIETGGISAGMNSYQNAKNLEDYKVTFEIKTRVLYDKMDRAFELMKEIMLSSKLSDTKRLYEIINELKSHLHGSMSSAGHSLAAVRAMSYFSKGALLSETTGGIAFYRLLEDLEENFEEKKEDLVAKLKQLTLLIFRPENLFVDYTATEDVLYKMPVLIEDLKKELYREPVDCEKWELLPVKKNEGFTTSAKIQYVSRAGNFISEGLPYTGALKVLKVIMGYEYLWQNVRVKGGAYGCMSNFGRSGDSYLVSYRDPNLTKTIEIYEQAAEFIKNFDADERTITKYIIGALSDMDIPLNPSAKGSRSLGAYMSELDYEVVQKEREQVLFVTSQIINGLSTYLDAILKENYICVVGNEEKIQESKELFDNVENLFH